MFPVEQTQARLYDLSISIIRYCRTLPHTDEAREVARQLRRASTGASANYRASRRGRSHAEWLAKISVAVEELDETQHWLSVLRDAGIGTPPQKLIAECNELLAVLTKSVGTARANRRT